MVNDNNSHTTYSQILQARNRQGLQKYEPFWKLKLTEDEYEGLKSTLINNAANLASYGEEAALCYAEWWRRDYHGGLPSKEEIAGGIGLNSNLGKDLFDAAKGALQKHGFSFIHTLKGTLYFRTLLNLGGLPINYIKNGNLGSFSRFLKELVSELSVINLDWNEADSSIIKQFNCISYLSKSFNNDNIYDVSMQIAQAIIMDDENLLPYDANDKALAELTESLKATHRRAKNQKRVRPLSLHWRLSVGENETAALFVNMDVVKDIAASSIPGLNTYECYAFDVFVAGTLVGKYVRKSYDRDADGNIIDAVYTRITTGINNDIVWHGEPVVEVKVRCDNGDRLFLTIAGCYPPNFEYPQVFQMLDENLYRWGETANAECNLAVCSSNWITDGAKHVNICGKEFFCKSFTNELTLWNPASGDSVTLTNTFTPYIAEFSGNYIPWVEESNYKILSRIPVVRVYDADRNLVSKRNNVKYRLRNESNGKWHSLSSACVFACGLVDIKVDFPDGHSVTETFYSIGDMKFESDKEEAMSTEIVCSCNPVIHPEIEQDDNLEIRQVADNRWKISRSRDTNVCPSVCNFRLYNPGNPVLCISIAIPFDGVIITDTRGNLVPNGKVISLSNLANYCIISHGGKDKRCRVQVSYESDKIEDYSQVKRLKDKVIDGLVSLADYNDLIMRMFNLYGSNTSDRSSAVSLNVADIKVYVRKFVLDTTIEDGMIRITDDTEDCTDNFVYNGDVYATPVGEDVPNSEFYPVKLRRMSDNDNLFAFPDEFIFPEVIVFSGPDALRRIIPKWYDRNGCDLSKVERGEHTKSNMEYWRDALSNEEVMTGKHWKEVCTAFDICSRFRLPFATYNGLKIIGHAPQLLANFVIAMWVNNYKDVLLQEIDRLEQEMVVALHWIPAKTWADCISMLMATIPEPLRPMIYKKIESFVELLQDLFDSTISADIASDFAMYLVSETIEKDSMFTTHDILNYSSKIHGLSDNNKDLPCLHIGISSQRRYYPKLTLLPAYKTMIKSAICAAENVCMKEEYTNLFALDNLEVARVVNFYRKYFKQTYSEIFFKSIKYIMTK